MNTSIPPKTLYNAGSTNARKVTNILPNIEGVNPTSRLRWIANELVKGPEDIFVKRTNRGNGNSVHYERVFYASLRIPNNTLSSWALFGTEREFGNLETGNNQSNIGAGVVIKRTVWDTASDLSHTLPEKHQPTIATDLWYIPNKYCGDLFQTLVLFDNFVMNGISIQRKLKRDQPSWSELEFTRTFDLSTISYNLNSLGGNQDCENLVFAVVSSMNEVLTTYKMSKINFVQQLTLRYQLSPGPAQGILFPEH